MLELDPLKASAKSAAYEIGHWLPAKRKGWNFDEEDVAVVNKQLLGLIDLVVNEVYE